jgi:hypothetical protein
MLKPEIGPVFKSQHLKHEKLAIPDFYTNFHKCSGPATLADTPSLDGLHSTAGVTTAGVSDGFDVSETGSTFVVKVMPIRPSKTFEHAITRRGTPEWRVRPNIRTQANLCWYREGCGAGNDFTILGRVEGADTERLALLKLDVQLLFEDGTPTPVSVQYHSPPKISTDSTFEIRAAIQDVSRNNQNKAFKFRISVQSESGMNVALFAETEPVFVRSKPPKKKKRLEIKPDFKSAIKDETTRSDTDGAWHERKRSFESISPPVSETSVHPLIDRMCAESPTASPEDSVTSLQAGIKEADDAAHLARERKQLLKQKCAAVIAKKRRRIAELEDECKQLMQLVSSEEEKADIVKPTTAAPVPLPSHGSVTSSILHI